MRRFMLLCVCILGLAQWACAAKTAQTLILNAPTCKTNHENLTDALEAQSKNLTAALDGRVLVENEVTSSKKAQQVARALLPPRLVIYSGHGNKPLSKSNPHSTLCLDQALDPEDLLAPKVQPGQRDSTSIPATLVLNTCSSNYLDLRDRAPGISVISASFGTLSTNSGFANAVAESLKDKDRTLDENCDGIVTDEELFNHMVNRLQSYEFKKDFVPSVELRAQPLLQRHARSQLPLPVQSKCRHIVHAPRVDGSSRDIEVLNAALAAQENYARGASSRYTELDYDYFVIVKPAGLSSGNETELDNALVADERGNMLKKFPGTYDEAVAVARYSIFAEVFAIEMYPPAYRVVRLRNDTLAATRLSNIQAVVEAFPYRDQKFKMDMDVENGSTKKIESITFDFRILRDSARLGPVEAADWKASPCERTLVGECFKRESPKPKQNEDDSKVNTDTSGRQSKDVSKGGILQ